MCKQSFSEEKKLCTKRKTALPNSTKLRLRYASVPESQSAIVGEKPLPSCAIKTLAKKRSFVPNAKPLSQIAPNPDSGMLAVPESQSAIVGEKPLPSCANKALAKKRSFVPNAKPLSLKAPNPDSGMLAYRSRNLR